MKSAWLQRSICIFGKRLKKVSNEKPNNVLLVCLHHVSELRFRDVLLIYLYHIFKLNYHEFQLVGFM